MKPKFNRPRRGTPKILECELPSEEPISSSECASKIIKATDVPPTSISADVMQCEEEDNSFKTEEPQLEDVLFEIKSMNKYLDGVQAKLRLDIRIPICPSPEDCVGPSLELKGSPYQAILDLQRDSMRLQHQIDDMYHCGRSFNIALNDLKNQSQNQLLVLRQCQKAYDRSNSFKLTMEREYGLCKQRYRLLKEVELSFTVSNDQLQELAKIFKMCLDRMQNRDKYISQKRRIYAEINNTQNVTRQSLQELFVYARSVQRNHWDSCQWFPFRTAGRHIRPSCMWRKSSSIRSATDQTTSEADESESENRSVRIRRVLRFEI